MRSKGNLRKRLLAAVCTALALAVVCAALVLAPDVSKAAEDEVAQIGSTKYATLEDALDAAAESEDDSVTITLLQSLEITKSISIPTGRTYTLTADADADITITDTGRYGIKPNGSLTMENITFITNGQIALNGSTSAGPFGREIVFSNVTLKMDGEMYAFNSDGYYCCAIFADSPALFVFDGCTVEIKNYTSTGSAIRWNGSNDDRGYGVEIINGTVFTSSNCYAGFTGTLDVLIDSSEVNVLNHRGNGSNGTYYTIKDGSYVKFDGNGSWGISAWRIDMTNSSTLVATNNGWSGVWARVLNVDSTCTLEVTDNGYSGSFTGAAGSTSGASNAGISFYGNGTYKSTIEEGASVTIQNNAGPGIATLQTVANLTIGSATITNNGSYSAAYGGGIYNIGTVSLGADVELYNNHASTAGDDIYSNSTKTITFGTVGSKWVLDDCDHYIDGWYDDSVSTQDDDGTSTGGRWEAHADTEAGETNHIEEYADFTDGLATVTGLVQLKAAHGADAQDKTSYPGMEKVIVTGDGNVDSDSAAAGDTVDFKLTTNVPDDLLNYIIPDVTDPDVDESGISTMASVPIEERGEYALTIHDVMDEAFNMTDAPVVTLDREGTDNDVVLAATYTTDTGDGCTFHIVMDLVALYEDGVITDEDIENATPITVTYSATLSEDATAGAYLNTAWVAYPEDESEHSQVTVETFGISIFKYDQANNDPLAGAIFTLYADEGCTEVIDTDQSNADGYVVFDGLDEGTYYLKETEAPEGYVCDDTVLEIVIPTQASSSSYIVSASFANASIPSTGGTGTWMLMLGGLALVVAGVAVLAVRRVRSHRA